MPDSNRPYEHYSEAEIMRDMDSLQESYDDVNAEVDRMDHRANREDRKEKTDHLSSLSGQINRYERELKLRREERAAGKRRG
jgi:hypothetical protein